MGIDVVKPLERLANRLRARGLKVSEGEPLWRHTTLRVGGPADLFCEVDTVSQLLSAVEAAGEEGIQYTIIGGGSNLLVADGGVRGLVIKNRSRGCLLLPRPAEGELFFSVPDGCALSPSGLDGNEGWLLAAGGEPIARLARRLVKLGIEGLHWAAGLPGSVASAVVNNAGAFGGDTASSIERAAVVEASGRHLMTAADLDAGYRSSRLKGRRDAVVVSVEFRVRRGNRAELMKFLASADTFRRTRQPREPSCGSVFKNPELAPAGYLIEQAGLKGTRIGGAQISPVHANFIVNLGGARAEDVLALMELCRERVKAVFGVELEPEIELLGSW